ncbi:MAG: hypothetical protein K8J08_11420 [Thermoanaerobaculia bacterium]|nr:hypothetical protein [Thermoanaerobaculia bacterium]
MALGALAGLGLALLVLPAEAMALDSGQATLEDAKPAPEDWLIEEREFSQAVPSSTSVRLENLWGDVRLRAGEGDRIVITTIVQKHREDPRDVDFGISEGSDGALEITVGFAADPEGVKIRPEWSPRRVDLGIFVPAGLSISIHGEDDLVELRGLEGATVVETTSGEIKFRGKGELRATTDSGSILAQFRDTNWEHPSVLSTNTGSVRVEFLEGAAVDVALETRGPITSDFSTEIRRQAGHRLKTGLVKIGSGGPDLEIKSFNGSVRLQAVIVPESTPPD